MTGLIRIHEFFYELFISYNVIPFYAEILNFIILTVIIFLGLFIINFISKKIISKLFKSLSVNTKTNFDDFLIINKTPIYISKLVPAALLFLIIPFWLYSYEFLVGYALQILEIYLVLLIVWIIRSVLRALKVYLKTVDSFKDKPIESFIQVVLILI